MTQQILETIKMVDSLSGKFPEFGAKPLANKIAYVELNLHPNWRALGLSAIRSYRAFMKTDPRVHLNRNDYMHCIKREQRQLADERLMLRIRTAEINQRTQGLRLS